MSHYLNGPECNYSATDRDFIAILIALKHWGHYLLGKQFVYRADHASMKSCRLSQYLTGAKLNT